MTAIGATCLPLNSERPCSLRLLVWDKDNGGGFEPDHSARRTVVANDSADRKGELKRIGGSQSDSWNNILINQAASALWISNSSVEERGVQLTATVSALAGIALRDELESMIAAQLIASHNAAMECYRRAMIGEQTFEGRREALLQANKLSRTHAMLLEALNRHRGKGQQKVTVEHVHVHAGGQAVVGTVEASGGRGSVDKGDRMQPSHMALSPRCGARTRSGSLCRSPAMPNGRCRMHGGASPGPPKGNCNVLKHGRYRAEAIARRKEISALVRLMKELGALSEEHD